jgi:virulence factor Mce-like protein
MSRSKLVASVAVVLAFAAVCLFGIGFLAVNMGLQTPFGQHFQVKADFASANGLVPLDQVRVAGVAVGKVTSIDPADDGGTLVSMDLDPTVQLPVGTRAVIRPKSLLGEQFVELVRPRSGADGGVLQNGATIGKNLTGQSVQIDDILNAVADPQTRAAMSESFRELGVALDGQAGNINASLDPLDATMTNFRPLARVGEERQQELNRILTNLNTIMQALADEQDALGNIVDSGDAVMSAMSARDQALAGTVTKAAAVFTSLDQAFNGVTVADRTSLQLSPGAIAAGRHVLGLTTPGLDQIIPELLLAQVGWPNNELGLTNSQSLTLAREWISAFSNRPAPSGIHALEITSICPTIGGNPNPCTSGGSPGISGGAALPGAQGALPGDLSQMLLQALGAAP